MAAIAVRLKRRDVIAEGTMAFYFEKPAGFTFKAGQYVQLALPDPPETDDEGNDRVFSIASAPFERDLMMATRMRDSAFKRLLRDLPLGTEFQMEGPYGSFVLHSDTSYPAVFIAGGIGITPVRSIVIQAAQDKTGHEIYLFYSNRRPEEAAFLKDLVAAEEENPRYKFAGTMTRMDRSAKPWHGETGHINREMMAKYISDLSAPLFHVVGPPRMVTAMRIMLAQAGIEKGKIRTEQFSGY